MVTTEQLVMANIGKIESVIEGLAGSQTVILIMFDTLRNEAIEALDLMEEHNIKGTEITRLFRENENDPFKFMEALRKKQE